MDGNVVRRVTRPIELPALIVGPVRDDWKSAEGLVSEHEGRARWVVFLGDYWGSGVDGDGCFESTCSWLFHSLGVYRRVHLAGVRELKLLAPSHPQVVSDGWSRYQQGIFDLVWGEAFRAMMTLAVRAGGWLVSNQGFGHELVRERTADELVALADDARWRALLGHEHPLLDHWHMRNEVAVTAHHREAELDGPLQLTDRVSQVCRYQWPVGTDVGAGGRTDSAPVDLGVCDEAREIERLTGHSAGSGRMVFVGRGPVEAVLLHEDGRVERVRSRGTGRTNRSCSSGALRL